jgi:hypothetical protein
MGAAHLIQHALCNLFGRHFSFAKKKLLRDNTGPALVRIAYRETHAAGNRANPQGCPAPSFREGRLTGPKCADVSHAGPDRLRPRLQDGA